MRAPWQRGAFSPEEVARALNGRREEFCGALGRRRDAAGVAAGLHGEIVDEAICAVVMSRQPIASEEHLLGAFWTAVGLVLKEHQAGRRLLRVGSRERVDFELAAARAPAGDEPFDVVELREQMARAADLMAALGAFERRVVVVMAVSGGGVKLAAGMLGVPVRTVRAAVRSADEKLDQVAVISAAGRMCSYRRSAIVAEASGVAGGDQARAARAHVAACAPCRRLYVGLRREMRGREFQRAAAAAFLPMPVAPLAHAGAGGLGKLAVWVEQRVGLLPRGSGERAAEVLGGAGVAKAAVAGTAIVAATASIAAHTLSSPQPRTTARHHHRHGAAAIARPASSASAAQSVAGVPTPAAGSASRASAASSPRHSQQSARAKRLPPGLGYLAIGGGAGSARSRPVVATAASVGAAGSTSSTSSAPSGSSTGHTTSPDSTTGGRFNYLGR